MEAEDVIENRKRNREISSEDSTAGIKIASDRRLKERELAGKQRAKKGKTSAQVRSRSSSRTGLPRKMEAKVQRSGTIERSHANNPLKSQVSQTGVCESGNSSVSQSVRKYNGKQAVVISEFRGSFTRQDAQDEEEVRFESSAKPPFVVFLRFQTADRKSSPLSILKVGQELTRSVVKFINVEKHAWNTWQVTFESRSLANNALDNKFIRDKGFILYIPRFLRQRQGVISDIDVDIDLAELTDTIEQENRGIQIQKIFRL